MSMMRMYLKSNGKHNLKQAKDQLRKRIQPPTCSQKEPGRGSLETESSRNQSLACSVSRGYSGANLAGHQVQSKGSSKSRHGDVSQPLCWKLVTPHFTWPRFMASARLGITPQPWTGANRSRTKMILAPTPIPHPSPAVQKGPKSVGRCPVRECKQCQLRPFKVLVVNRATLACDLQAVVPVCC